MDAARGGAPLVQLAGIRWATPRPDPSGMGTFFAAEGDRPPQLAEEAGEPVEQRSEALDGQPVLPARSLIDGILIGPPAPVEEVGPTSLKEHDGALLLTLLHLDSDGVSFSNI